MVWNKCWARSILDPEAFGTTLFGKYPLLPSLSEKSSRTTSRDARFTTSQVTLIDCPRPPETLPRIGDQAKETNALSAVFANNQFA